jgi:hypothetical protein
MSIPDSMSIASIQIFYVSVAETVFMIGYCREICNANIHRYVVTRQINTFHRSRKQGVGHAS